MDMSEWRQIWRKRTADSRVRFCGFVFLSAVCMGWLAIIWGSKTFFLFLMPDDAYYYLKTATNIVAGYGVTFDQLNPTNGFHPLWMVILAPISALIGHDMVLLTRTVLSVQVAFTFLGTVLVARRIPVGGAWVGAVAAVMLTSIYSAKVLVNGMESSVEYLLICLALGYWWGVGDARGRRGLAAAVTLGLLSGLVTLARLDGVLFSLPLLLMPLIWPEKSQTPARNTELVTRCIVGLAAFGLVVAPYFAWNMLSFGHLMPVSIAIKSGNAPAFGALIRLAGGLLVLACLVAFRFAGRKWVRERRWLFPLVVCVGLETASLFATKGIIMPQLWYLAPHLLLMVLVGSIIAESVRVQPSRRWLPALAASAYLLFAAVCWANSWGPFALDARTVRHETGRWLSKYTPAEAIIAGWDCGICAAYSDRRFINLDGLINSWEYKTNYLDTDRIDEFINDAHRVDYVAQYVRCDDSSSYQDRMIRGVDFSDWYVVRAQLMHCRLDAFLHPWTYTDYVYLVLSRRPPPTIRPATTPPVALTFGP